MEEKADGAPAPQWFWEDVPSGHWAYDCAFALARSGIVIGYPDGTFGGKRAMTRYEFGVGAARVLPELERQAQGRRAHRAGRETLKDWQPIVLTRADFECLRRLVREFGPVMEWLKADVPKVLLDLDRLERDLLPAERPPFFRDVPREHWAFDSVQDLAARGLVVGYPAPGR